MTDVSKKDEETNETKEQVKKMNVDAVAKILTGMQDDNHTVKSQFVDLKRIVTNLTQDIAELRAQTNVLKAMGGRGILGGTGSTVHKQGE